jgi:hypothetical protein
MDFYEAVRGSTPYSDIIIALVSRQKHGTVHTRQYPKFEKSRTHNNDQTGSLKKRHIDAELGQ